MTDTTIIYAPLGEWPRPDFTEDRRRSQFKDNWPKTWQTLRYELGRLDVENAVLRVDVDRSRIRVDGSLHAQASPISPCVVLNFAAPKTGPVVMPCDTYDNWRHNVRAIALALEALRTVDRYGVTSRAEQYRGWAALPAPPQPDFRNEAEARAFIRSLFSEGLRSAMSTEELLRKAEIITHPDRGGSADDFKKVQSARKLLLSNSAHA